MKRYESSAEQRLVRRLPVAIRIDGKRFSQLVKRLKVDRPFDQRLLTAMENTALEVARSITGCVFAYTQSDEISLILRNDQSRESEPYLDNRVQKICSIAASVTTGWFNRQMDVRFERPLTPAAFDARVFALPSIEEAKNYLIWRQQDCTRNSILNAAYWEIAAKGKGEDGEPLGKKTARKLIHGLNTDQLQELLFQRTGINWNDYDPRFKRGVGLWRQEQEIETPNGKALRRPWVAKEVPIFHTPEGKKWLGQQVGDLQSMELMIANKMAAAVDYSTYKGIIDSRSVLADIRLDFGHPFTREEVEKILGISCSGN